MKITSSKTPFYSMMTLWSWGIHFYRMYHKPACKIHHSVYSIVNTCYFSLEISANVLTLHNLIQMKIWTWGLLFFKKPYTNLKRSWIITNKTQVFPKETLFICICRDIPAVKTSAELCASWYQHSLCKFLISQMIHSYHNHDKEQWTAWPYHLWSKSLKTS